MTKQSPKTDHVALYRKYRPDTFKEVIGQDHIVNVLENSVKLGNISHAYLFAGSRGTGKTSIARIFARAIGTSANDMYEIDAASNRGIDDVREIRDGVHVIPFDSKYKVYIIDEVHMLTKEAFNALLKTLEEPPAHAIFILATTEMDKLPETVISRCQTFTFKRPNVSTLKEFVGVIAKKEGSSLESAAADLIALLADGSFRDAHGILQKVLVSTDDAKVTLDEVEKVAGAPKRKIVNDIIESVAEQSLHKGLSAIEEARNANVDMKLFGKLILEKLRFVLLLRFDKTMSEGIASRVSEEDFKWLSDLAGKAININSNVLLKFLEAYEHLGKTHIPELPLELALVEVVGGEPK